MPTLKETLKRLATTFTVRDIMVPRGGLVCSDDEEHASKVSDDNPDFNVIPIPQEGPLTGYFERDSRNTKKIALNDLISDGTSLLDLVEILEDRQFCFESPPRGNFKCKKPARQIKHENFLGCSRLLLRCLSNRSRDRIRKRSPPHPIRHRCKVHYSIFCHFPPHRCRGRGRRCFAQALS
jgi:hypothetical protein